ncbi:glycine betaine ABC transporter substrate-binding protein [Pseudonocardia phyllosphaerae]|uniref:glycine betaine ABC transporter substrate-binding protein n=1 Tax=Pseudonocardia phyllosphaerae TaxID=3390502 RepID=UPI00397C4614
MTARRPLRRVRAAALCAVTVLAAGVVAGCGLSSAGPDVSPGSLADAADLTGRTYVVGSKNFDEQILLCHITIAALQSANASVTDRCDTGGSDVTRRALQSGDISIYWEYTGTAWASFLRQTRKLPEPQLLTALRHEDEQRNGILWLQPAGFDNTYAFTVAGTTAARLNLRTLDDMAAYVRANKPGTVCVETEYSSREDGLRGLQKAYGFTLPPGRSEVLDAGLIYQSTADGVCLFGEVGTSDGRIPGLGLKVLADDRGYHGTYKAVPTIRKDVYDQDPDVAKVLDPIASALDYPTILALNEKVSAQGQDPRTVAREWLAQRGFTGSE